MNTTRRWILATALAALTGAAAAAVPEHVLIQAPSRASTQPLLGEYALADGRVLVVSRRGGQLMAALEGQPATALLLRQASRWASSDGRLTLEFHAHANGLVSGLTLQQRR